MKGIVFCNKGIEDISMIEIKEIIGKKSVKGIGYVVFDCTKEELLKLIYLMQSISKGILITDELDFKDEKEIQSKIKKMDFGLGESFKVDSRIINSNIGHENFNGDIGKIIQDKFKTKVDLEEPETVVYIFVDKNKCYIGVDFSKIDLSKRNYRVFSLSKNIKSTIAYAMVRFSDYKKGEVLVDPFALAGSVVIEAALFRNNFPVRYYEKNELDLIFDDIDKKRSNAKNNIFAIDASFKNVDSARKNAKIAGINKAIIFSRLEVEWLDTKFDKESVDRIVSCLPIISKNVNENFIVKLYKEFFHQAEFVLKKKGRIVVCVKHKEKVLECCSGFKVEEEREVWQGKDKYWLLKLKK